MGVYIKGMEMPKNSRNCPFTEIDDWNRRCIVKGKFEWHRDRLCDNCPLIEVPDHGRLIDADALMQMCGMAADCYDCQNGEHGWCKRSQEAANICEAIEDAPTIIPADKEETCTKS